MISVRPFNPADLELMELQPAQARELAAVPNWRRMGREAAMHGPAWTALGFGQVLGCAGIAVVWPGRARAWCYLADDIPRAAWTGLHRAVLGRFALLPDLGVRRLEANVLDGFDAGERWVRMLGFHLETVSPAWGPGGEAFRRYARFFQ